MTDEHLRLATAFAAVYLVTDDNEQTVQSQGLTQGQIDILVDDTGHLAAYFEATLKWYKNPRQVATWLINEYLHYWRAPDFNNLPIRPYETALLVMAVDFGKLSRNRAKEIIKEVYQLSPKEE